MGKSGEEKGFRCENLSWELVLFYIHIERFSHRIYIRFSAGVSWCCWSSFFATSMHNYLQLLIVFCSFQFYDLASVVSIQQKILHYLVVMFQNYPIVVKSSSKIENFIAKWWNPFKASLNIVIFLENRNFVTALLLRQCCFFSPITTAFLTEWSNYINYFFN